MANYLFPSNAQGWDVPGGFGFEWTIADGSPSLGCLVAGDPDAVDPGTPGASTSISGLSLPVAVDDPFSCRVRITYNGDGGNGGVTHTKISLIGGITTYVSEIIDHTIIDDEPFDSGWFLVTGAVTNIDTITEVIFLVTTSDPGVSIVTYLDSVYVAETPPAGGFVLTRSAGGISGAVAI